jgi:PiT family inorganic phosphate transporter
MTDSFLILIFVVVLALLSDFFLGWHDGANVVAAVVSTRVLSPGRAVLTAAVLNGAGAFMSMAMAKMVGGEIVEASVITHRMVIAASVGAIAWNMVTLFLGFPTSSSRALLGGLIGAALSQGGMAAVKFSGLRAV